MFSKAAALITARQDGGGGGGGGGGDTSSTDQLLDLLSDPFKSQLQSDAFFASLGTSIGLTALVALLFCFLRPYNSVVYAPRAKHADSKHAPPPVSKGMFAWISPVQKTKEQDLIDKVGMDAAVFIRFVRMCRNIFIALSVVGCGILIPTYLVSATDLGAPGKRKRQADYSTGEGVTFFYKLTPRVEGMYGSQAYWALVVCAYLFDVIICYFLWHNYRHVTRMRRAYFDSEEYQRSLHSRTLLVTDIPKEFRTDDGIVKLTDEVNATDATPRAAVARNVKDLPDLVEEHEEMVRLLEGYLAKYLKHPDKLPAKRPTCKVSKNDKGYTKGQKVDAIEYLAARIKKLEIEIREVRESVDKRNALPYGFASYEKIADAHSVAYVARNKGPQDTIIRLAPKPSDLVWKNLKMMKKDRNWQNFMSNVWVGVLTVVWVAPNVFIAVFLANLPNLGKLWPAFQTNLEEHRQWWAIVQGVAAPAITSLFYYYLPAIFRRLSINAGDVTKTSRERHVMHKLFSFFIVNNLIVFSLFAAIWGFVVAVIGNNDGKGWWDAIVRSHFFTTVINTLCDISPYWISWLLQRNLGAAVDLSQLTSLAWGSFSRKYRSVTPRQVIELSAPQAFDYAGYYNYFLFYATVALSFATIQPLVLPVTAFYFSMDTYLKKYLLLYVFITKYESGGMFWRAICNRVLFAALLGNVVVALIVVAFAEGGVNWGMLASLGPLPFLIMGFKWYCMRTFDDEIHYFQKGKALKDTEMVTHEHKSRKGDRVGVRFGHPVLYKPLMTPMVNAKAQHLLKQIYSGRTSLDDTRTVAGYSDVYMDTMDSSKPGKPTDTAPFEFVDDNHMDFEHYKSRPEFRDEAGGDGGLYGRPQDLVRPGTPGSMMTGITRTGTMDSSAEQSRSRSESRHARFDSGDSDLTKVAGETEYPRGYHQTPNLREASPAPSERSLDSHRGRSWSVGPRASREGLVQNAGRIGMSPPPQLGMPVAPTPGGYGPIHTPGSESGAEDTSYDYFRRGRNL